MLICEEAEAYKRGWVTCSMLEKWTSWDEEQVFLPSSPCSSSPSGNHVWLLQKIMLVETCVFRACMGLWASSLALSVILSRHYSFGQRAYNCRRWWSLVVQAGHSLHAYEITQYRMELQVGRPDDPGVCSLYAATLQWNSNSISWERKKLPDCCHSGANLPKRAMICWT